MTTTKKKSNKNNCNKLTFAGGVVVDLDASDVDERFSLIEFSIYKK